MLSVLRHPLGGGSCLGHFWSRASQGISVPTETAPCADMLCLDASPSLLVTFRPRSLQSSGGVAAGRGECVLCARLALRTLKRLAPPGSPAITKSQSWHKNHSLAPLAALNPLVKAIGQRSLAKARNSKRLRDHMGSPRAIEVGDVAILSGRQRWRGQVSIARRHVSSSHRPQKSPDSYCFASLPGTIHCSKAATSSSCRLEEEVDVEGASRHSRFFALSRLHFSSTRNDRSRLQTQVPHESLLLLRAISTG